jgi:hypothetical protein
LLDNLQSQLIIPRHAHSNKAQILILTFLFLSFGAYGSTVIPFVGGLIHHRHADVVANGTTMVNVFGG